MNSEHILTEEFYPDLRRRVLLRAVPTLVLGLGAGWYIAGARTDWIGIVPIAFIALALMPFTFWRTLLRQEKSFRTLRIKIADGLIIKIQTGFPLLAFPLNEITSLQEIPGRGLLVTGRIKSHQIALPPTLEGFAGLRAVLVEHHPITAKRDTQGHVIQLAYAFLSVASLVIFYRARSPAIVLSMGTLIVGVLVVCFILTQKSPHLDRRAKLAAWTSWLVVISLVIRMWHFL